MFIKLIMPFDLVVCRDNILSYSCHRIKAHLYVFVKVIDTKISVYFHIGIDDKLIDFFELISCFRVQIPPIFQNIATELYFWRVPRWNNLGGCLFPNFSDALSNLSMRFSINFSISSSLAPFYFYLS